MTNNSTKNFAFTKRLYYKKIRPRSKCLRQQETPCFQSILPTTSFLWRIPSSVAKLRAFSKIQPASGKPQGAPWALSSFEDENPPDVGI